MVLEVCLHVAGLKSDLSVEEIQRNSPHILFLYYSAGLKNPNMSVIVLAKIRHFGSAARLRRYRCLLNSYWWHVITHRNAFDLACMHERSLRSYINFMLVLIITIYCWKLNVK